MSSGLKLPGNFSTFTVASLTDVGSGLVDTVTTTVTEVTRTAATDSQAFTYYIRADYNINSNISYTPTSATGGLDDAWGMSAIAITKDNASGASVVLPSGSKSIDAGLITIKEGDESSATAGTFAATLVLALSSAGLLTVTSLSITGSDVTVSETENNLLAQLVEVALPGTTSNASNVTATSADTLSDTVTASDVTSAYSSQISTIEGYYNNVSVLTDWAISVSAVTSSTDNALAQHARNLSRTSTAVFSENALVVASTPSTYTVAVNDYAGTSQQIATGSVYGVVRQTGAGAAIDP
jgi:hypothetical protein